MFFENHAAENKDQNLFLVVNTNLNETPPHDLFIVIKLNRWYTNIFAMMVWFLSKTNVLFVCNVTWDISLGKGFIAEQQITLKKKRKKLSFPCWHYEMNPVFSSLFTLESFWEDIFSVVINAVTDDSRLLIMSGSFICSSQDDPGSSRILLLKLQNSYKK